jgi:hypothetical protein
MRVRWACRLAALAATVLLAGCTSAQGGPTGAPSAAPSPHSSAASSEYPDSMVVLGHSGATGYDSDPQAPGTDAPRNSWATGDNPAVQSIYLRLLALNPAIKGHATNLAVDGSDVTALPAQVDAALQVRPVPQLFLIGSVDNDMRCDGTDPKNYEPFRQQISAVLTRIAKGAPGADILVVSSPWATAGNYADVAAKSGEGRSINSGSGPCDAFDLNGRLQPAHLAYFEKVAGRYFAELAAGCRAVPRCRYDGGALHAMRITSADVTPDFNHLSIAGQAKQAAVEWKVLSTRN